jgi:hypothetical protein
MRVNATYRPVSPLPLPLPPQGIALKKKLYTVYNSRKYCGCRNLSREIHHLSNKLIENLILVVPYVGGDT